MNMKEEAFNAVVDVNLKEAQPLIRHCSPIFVQKKRQDNQYQFGGGPSENPSGQLCLRGRAIGLTKSLAGAGVAQYHHNAIAPGLFGQAENITQDNPLMARIPLGRVGTPEEVASSRHFCQDRANYNRRGYQNDGGL